MPYTWDEPENLPLRFNAPDGWRAPDPTWVALHQGFEPPANWQPYPHCPPIPPQWPLWEENGAAWYQFFRQVQAPPTRGLGAWFSLTALGLFTMTASPFALGWPDFLIWSLVGTGVAIIGVLGVVRHFRKSAQGPSDDPMDIIRTFSSERRDEFFARQYQKHVQSGAKEKSYDEVIDGLYAWWWRENASDAASS